MPASVRDVLLLIRTKEDAQRALAGISREMRRTSAVADAANARARARAARMAAETMRHTGATRAQILAMQGQARAYEEQARTIERTAKQHERLRRAVLDSTQVLTAAGFAGIAAGAGILYGLKQAVDIAAEYDRQTRLTFTQVDRRFKPSLIELGEIGRRVAKEIALPFEQIQPALFEVFSSTEANVKEAEQLLKAFGKAAVAGQTDFQTASRATIGLMNTFGVPFSKVNRLLDIQFQLVQEGVGTYEEWATRIGLVSPSAARAGQSIETMAAALATATRMGMSAARAGTSVARAFDAVSNPKTISKLEKMGVKMRDAKGNMLPLLDIMKQWKRALDKLPPKDRLESILETLKGAGSTIEARRFLQNMLMTKDGLKLFEDVLGEFTGDVGAFDRAYGEMADSTSAKSTLVRNQWQLLKEAIGRALLPAFEKLLKGLQALLDKFNALPKSTQRNIAMFLLIAGVLGLVGGAALLAVGAIAGLTIALGAMATVGWEVYLIVGVIVLAIIGLALTFKKLYDDSKPFRDLLDNIKDAAKEVWDILSGFAEDVAAKFRENLLPALRKLWQTIETEVLPKINDFVSEVREKFIPKIKEAAAIIVDVLAIAFDFLSWIIENMVIPAIKRVTDAYKENKEYLDPVIEALGFLAKIMLIVTAVIFGVFIVGLAALAAVLIYVGSFAVQGLILFIAWLSNAIEVCIDALKRFWKWLNDLNDRLEKTGRQVGQTAGQIRNALVGAFLGLPGMFGDIGSSIVQGLINGMRGRISDLRSTASLLGQVALNAAAAAVGVASPSKKFKQIGYFIVQGLIKGINGSRDQLKSSMQRLMRDVMNSLKAGGASKKLQQSWSKRMTRDMNKLLALESKRAAVNKKLAAAQEKLKNLQKERADLAGRIRERLASEADLSGIDGRSPQQIQKTLQKRLEALRKFQQDLATLKAKGLNAATIAELAEAGVDSGGSVAAALAKGTTDDIRNVNKMQDEIRKIAAAVGDKSAGAMYDAGIKAAQGLVKGLQSQAAKITKEMEKIANALIAAIKKKLGIKSPSRVFMDIGVNTAKGYINGYKQAMRKANNMHAEMMALAGNATPGPVGFGSNRMPALTPTSSRTFNQTINVTTREIDPRKHAAELGWELEGRLR